jgi:hypothetical protein
MSLKTPLETVAKLQTSLQGKAKAEPAYRFYVLWIRSAARTFSEKLTSAPAEMRERAVLIARRSSRSKPREWNFGWKHCDRI